jgi:hypothetical protein
MIHYNGPETATDFHSRNFAPACSQFACHILMALRGSDAWQAEVGEFASARRDRVRPIQSPESIFYRRKARPSWACRTFRVLVNTGATIHNGRHRVDQTLMAMQEMERYCATHPDTPVSLRHPRLFMRGRTFVALLGPSIEEGIAGFGDTVQAALRAFDRQYSRSLTPSHVE